MSSAVDNAFLQPIDREKYYIHVRYTLSVYIVAYRLSHTYTVNDNDINKYTYYWYVRDIVEKFTGVLLVIARVSFK